ncbi:hypothetical protein [Streptomyces montanisoli]|uniref:Uncharacterized protein n=1 Tax=Streptomyces montanisoli TaxID=2798581 RepID=A0A940MA31_9ACTN|nr:hypothetical protein [Streptomyces montanisoli]MBP0457138.1 hypothetical protein [Streptomyces montanisoli]
MPAKRAVPDIAVVAVAEDAAVSRSLCRFLHDVGLAPGDDAGSADIAVVVISESSVDDPVWQERVDGCQGARVVPVRVDGVRSSRAPKWLRSLNWVNLDVNSPVDAFGMVFVAAVSDPRHVRELRNLRAQADAWTGAERSPERLIGDHRQAAEARELLALLREDGYIDTSGSVGDFVQASYRHTGKQRRRTRRRRTVATVFAVAMALIVAVTLPRILKTRGTDFNALVSFGDPAVSRVMPQWTSLQSASLLLRGNAHQKSLARQSLASLLSLPWSLGEPVVEIGGRSETIDGVALLPGGGQAALLVRDVPTGVDSLGLYDVHQGAVRRQIRLGAGYADIAAGGDGRTVVAVGKKGTAVIDLLSRKVRRFAHVESGYAVAGMTRRGDVVVGRRHQLVVGSVHDGAFRSVGPRYDELLDVRPTGDGGARALVVAAPGHYRLLNALTGAVLASADTGKPLIAAGAVAPDEVSAVFAGADRQLWRLVPGHAPAATGVAVPDRTETMGLLRDGRVVVGGQDQPAHVVRLADGGDLGTVCSDVPQLRILEMSLYGDQLGCWGLYNTTLWQAPPGPLPAHTPPPDAGLSTKAGADGPTATVRADGGRILVKPAGRNGFSLRLFNDAISVMALSADGSQLVAATSRGEVAVVSLRMGDDVPRVVASWRIPGGQPATAAGWSGTSPLVRAGDGLLWRVPSCPGCTTDQGLIARLKARLNGCWIPRQLKNVDAATRRTLDAHECRPLPEPSTPVED